MVQVLGTIRSNGGGVGMGTFGFGTMRGG